MRIDAVLEPAYNITGNTFDHSVVKDILHTMILDAMGHDLTAGLTTSVAMAAARNARRSGAEPGRRRRLRRPGARPVAARLFLHRRAVRAGRRDRGAAL